MHESFRVLHLIRASSSSFYLNFLQNRPLRSSRSRIILPDALAAEVGVAIVTKFDAGGQVLEQFRVASSEHDVIDDKSTL